MRNWFPFALSTVLAVSLLPAQQGNRDGGGRRPRGGSDVEMKNLTFQEKSFHSEAIDADSQYGVFLPKGYDAPENKDVQYPLVIWLHGMFEDHLRFHDRGGAAVLDQVVGDGKLPPCVFVTPNGGRTSLYVNRKDARWEDLITKDLIAHLEKTYRISKARDQRAITGVSMGGMAALRIAFSQPELFGAVAAHSAAVFGEDPEQLPDRMKGFAKQLGLDEVFGDPIQKEPWQKANPLCLALKLDKQSLHGLRIYFDAGTKDRYHFDEGNKLLHEALDKQGIEHTWRLIDGGGHSWGANFEDQTLPHSFAMIGEMFAAASGKAHGLDGLSGALGGKDGKGGDAGDAKGEKGGQGAEPKPK